MRLLHSADAKIAKTDAEITQAIETVSEDFLRETVQTLAFPRHFTAEPRQNQLAAKWIRAQLQSYGYHTVMQGQFQNILAFPSENIPHELFVVGAHYDTVPASPGADDNASAVAAMLACARAVVHYAQDASVCFVAFNREEDNLIGSADFVDNYVVPHDLHIQQAHILEMVGYCSYAPNSQQKPPHLPIQLPEQGNFLGLVGSQKANPVIAELIQQARTYLPDFPVLGLQLFFGVERFFSNLLRSDHTPFWRRDFPAIMWTDTAEFRNPHYHRVSDTPDTLDYEFLRRVTQVLILHTLRTVKKTHIA